MKPALALLAAAILGAVTCSVLDSRSEEGEIDFMAKSLTEEGRALFNSINDFKGPDNRSWCSWLNQVGGQPERFDGKTVVFSNWFLHVHGIGNGAVDKLNQTGLSALSNQISAIYWTQRENKRCGP